MLGRKFLNRFFISGSTIPKQLILKTVKCPQQKQHFMTRTRLAKRHCLVHGVAGKKIFNIVKTSSEKHHSGTTNDGLIRRRITQNWVLFLLLLLLLLLLSTSTSTNTRNNTSASTSARILMLLLLLLLLLHHFYNTTTTTTTTTTMTTTTGPRITLIFQTALLPQPHPTATTHSISVQHPDAISSLVGFGLQGWNGY